MPSNAEESATTNPQAVPSSRRASDAHISSDLNGSPYSRAFSTARLGSPVRGQSARTPSYQPPTQKGSTFSEISTNQKALAGINDSSLARSPAGESALSKALHGVYQDSSPKPEASTGSKVSSDKAYISRQSSRAEINDSRGTAVQSTWNSPSRGMPYEDLEVVRRHLVGPIASSSPGTSGPLQSQNGFKSVTGKNGLQTSNSTPPHEDFSSLQLQGGDITRAVYRWTERAEEEAAKKRSKSFIIQRPAPDTETENFNTINQPGGFRRDFLRRTEPSPSPVRNQIAYGNRREGSISVQQQPFTSNFIEFLSLYGHFAGEALEEDDEDLGPDEYFDADEYDGSEYIDGARRPDEYSSLITSRKKRRKRKERRRGNGTATGAALLLVKSFVGTGVLFLPRAFLNGGMVFSTILLLFVSLLSYYCFVLLISTRLKVDLSFGDMGLHLYGRTFKSLINFSLVISQIGFTSAYIVFVSENLRAFVLAISNCAWDVEIKYLIFMQMIIFLPLSLYRNINKIQKFALVADVFILLGILYLWYYDILTLVTQHGVSDIVAFNSKDWTLFIGTAIFTFEGVGLILPIQEGMRSPKQFPRVLGLVMIGITAVFVTSGAMSYAAYGPKTQTVVLLNMNQRDRLVNTVQLIYSLAILLSTPLQIYPAIEITSQQLFSGTGKYNPFVKWKKNIFRFFMVIFCAEIAWLGADDLDKFVALVGSFACIPLVYIYPVSIDEDLIAK